MAGRDRPADQHLQSTETRVDILKKDGWERPASPPAPPSHRDGRRHVISAAGKKLELRALHTILYSWKYFCEILTWGSAML